MKVERRWLICVCVAYIRGATVLAAGGVESIYGDTEGTEVVIRRVHCTCKVQYGRLTMSVKVASMGEPSRVQAKGQRTRCVSQMRPPNGGVVGGRVAVW